MALNLEDRPVDTLVANDWNTNEVSPENEAKIEASLDRHSFYRPIIARDLGDGRLQILGGEHRWQIAKRRGMATVPVINLGQIDDQRAKEISLIDNARYGQDDTLRLAELLGDMGDVDDLIAVLPMNSADIEGIFSAARVGLDELDLPGDGDRLPDLALPTASGPTHQILRFKVPAEDADRLTRLVEATMKAQGFTNEDSLANAGNALVHLLRST